MKILKFFISFILMNTLILSAQIPLPNVTHINATQAALELSGEGVTIISSTLLGHPLQLGKFNNGLSVMNISDGILLTTGNAKYAEKYRFSYTDPAHTQIHISGNPIYPFDSDLSMITSGGQDMPVALEIEFISNSDYIEFEFVFASMEYPGWVGSTFNDAFVFTLSGPGINGNEGLMNNGINIAKLPNGIPITINTVNSVLNNF